MSKKSIKKNYLYNLTYTLLNTVLPLLTAPHLARVVGAEGVGIYAYYYAIAHTFYVFAKLGVTNYGTRQIAKAGDSYAYRSQLFSGIYYQQLITTGLSGCAYLLFCILFLKDEPNQKYALLMGINVFCGFFDIDWLHSGMENFKSISRRNIIVKFVSVSLIFLIVRQPGDLWKYVLIMTLSSFFGYCSLWLERRRYVRFCRVKFSDILIHIKPNLILVVPVFAINIYRSIDKIMLGAIAGTVQTGLFENAEKIIYALCGFITAFGTVMMPRTSQLIAQGKQKESTKNMVLSMQFMMFLLWGMAFGLAAISEDLVLLLFGEEFRASGNLMAILAFTLPFIGWANVVRTQYVIPMGLDRLYLITVSIGAIINICVNLCFMPQMGAMGAVIGTICAESSIPIAQFVLLRKKLPYALLVKRCMFAPISGMVMLVALRTFCAVLHANAVMNMMLRILAGIACYVLCNIIYVMIFERDIVYSMFDEKFQTKGR